ILESGQSLYIAFGQRLFGRAITRNDKREYNLAKIAVLSLGYGAGASKFCQVANAAGVSISQDEAENVVKLWRTANVAIVNAWLGVERAFRSTLHSPYGRSAHYRQIKFYGRENTVYIELPNGYRIYYPNCAIDRATGELSWSADGITREKLYGGKIWENIIQATAAQILRRALVILEDAGVEVILHIHDEIIAECDRSKARSTARLIANVMRSAPEWAPDMRLEIEQKIARRWTK
ncbi:MAG: DNA polymerase, partial [Leptospiraceae bacterium]|nr:DNA polymerase [Leptospiraceae bacterium]